MYSFFFKVRCCPCTVDAASLAYPRLEPQHVFGPTAEVTFKLTLVDY